MKSHAPQCLFACLLFAFMLPTSFASAQDAAAGLDPALLAKAKAGDAASEYLVAIEYQKGDIVPRDFVQAADWYRKAADQGYALAQYRLGLLYQQKESGIMKDDGQAAAWLRKAADQGNAPAQAALGLCFSQGTGVAQDDAQAVAWYQKAVAQTNPEAMVGLALMYDRGRGVPKDGKQAFALLHQGADLGSAEAEYQLGIDFENGQDVKKDKNQAADWYRKAADQGNIWAQFNLGQMLASKPAEAYFWLSLAMNHLDGDTLLKATVLHDDAASKLKPADKAQADDRINQWHPTPAAR
ncbi:MAG: tetratricopeptide repeat protein [Terracidiphilus sp.]|jgi:TPR repeat protein